MNGTARYKPLCIIPAALAGVALLLFFNWPLWGRVSTGTDDLLPLDSGTRFLGIPGLGDDPLQVQKIQFEVTSWHVESRQHLRLPYYALLLWPLGQLPYLTAYWLWQGLSACALRPRLTGYVASSGPAGLFWVLGSWLIPPEPAPQADVQVARSPGFPSEYAWIIAVPSGLPLRVEMATPKGRRA